jgi:hypothetical protein
MMMYSSEHHLPLSSEVKNQYGKARAARLCRTASSKCFAAGMDVLGLFVALLACAVAVVYCLLLYEWCPWYARHKGTAAVAECY